MWLCPPHPSPTMLSARCVHAPGSEVGHAWGLLARNSYAFVAGWNNAAAWQCGNQPLVPCPTRLLLPPPVQCVNTVMRALNITTYPTTA